MCPLATSSTDASGKGRVSQEESQERVPLTRSVPEILEGNLNGDSARRPFRETLCTTGGRKSVSLGATRYSASTRESGAIEDCVPLSHSTFTITLRSR